VRGAPLGLFFFFAFAGLAIPAGCRSPDRSEDPLTTSSLRSDAFVRPVVLSSAPLALTNPLHDTVIRPLWGGAFTRDTNAKAVSVHMQLEGSGGARLLFGRVVPELDEDARTRARERAPGEGGLLEIARVEGGWELRETESSLTALRFVSSEVVLTFEPSGRRVILATAEVAPRALELSRPLARSVGTYVGLAPAAELTVRELALTQPIQASGLGTPLRELAAPRGIAIGTATDVWPALSDERFEALLGEQFGLAAPTEFYWSTVRSDRDAFFFLAADLMVNYAGVHDQRIDGYFLVWDFELPAWLDELRRSNDARTKLGEVLDDHIRTMVGRYRGRVHGWAVVNEAIWGPEDRKGADSATWAHSIWSDILGHEYIERAFRVAHDADPEAVLIYNETGAESLGPKSDFVFAMAKDFRARDVPIGAIGFQFHLDAAKLPVLADVRANFERFAALGLTIQITELDVSLAHLDPQARERATAENLQAKIYADVLATCLAVRACRSYTTFGFSDKYAWDELGDASPLLFDDVYRAKPAFFAVQSLLAQPARTRTL
jgi:endo-1,4-beta-xylanase